MNEAIKQLLKTMDTCFAPQYLKDMLVTVLYCIKTKQYVYATGYS